ncbi:MAG: 30S ribosomal protein S12 methylthiotransferase RimO [Candidatus Omnitrophica bacterium]|nr:30S ribosomal protein S12 methylthiotransferase RimO [Candidatus Omnitrophota bacterium]
MRISMTSLGCPRNLVDSEVILGSLKKEGLKIVDIEDGADIAIINTCSFIQSAREESIDTILQASQLKKEGRIKYLVICGCLPQLYKKDILKEIPEADLVLGTSSFVRISEFIKDLRRGRRISRVSARVDYLYDEKSPRVSLTPAHYAYVKISEGCDNSCSYCIISRLRGHARSRSIESVLSEIKTLSSRGRLREINLIGQDTTYFGVDTRDKPQLPELLRKISRLKNSVRWVRLLYTHPAHYTDEIIKVVAEEDSICKYLDLPIQHINDRILKAMNRHTTKKKVMSLIEKLRKNISGLTLRSSVIVGFPGETEKEFKELLGFLRQVKFERLGAFVYSKEDGTAAARMPGQVPEKAKADRLDEVMKLQRGISSETNKKFLGKTLDVLIDERVEGEKGKFLGRTEGDAPEVDGLVYVTGDKVRIGRFSKVKITDTLEYDLIGEAA